MNAELMRKLRERIQARIVGYATRGDISVVTAPDALLDVKVLTAAVEAAELQGDLSPVPFSEQVLAWDVLGRTHLIRYDLDPPNRRDDIDLSLFYLTLVFLAGGTGIVPELLPVVIDRVIPAAVRMTTSADDAQDAEAVAKLWIRIAEGSDARAAMAAMANAGIAMDRKFQLTGDSADRDRSIELLTHAVVDMGYHRQRGDTPEGLEEAIDVLLSMCVTKWADDRSLAALDTAIVVAESALETCTGASLAKARYMLSALLTNRSEATGSHEDVRRAVELSRTAVAEPAAPNGVGPHPAADHLAVAVLGEALIRSFEFFGSRTDIDEVVDMLTSAREHNGTDSPDQLLHVLGNALRTRYMAYGTESDLHQAVEILRQALAASSAAGELQSIISLNFANTLRLRAALTGSSADLDDAIGLATAAADAFSESDYRRAATLACLGCCIWMRFERHGREPDLDFAIDVLQEASGMIGRSFDATVAHANLGSALAVRSLRKGSVEDIESAIAAFETGLESGPTAYNRAPLLSNFQGALYQRYKLTGDPDHLRQAIDAGYRALEEVPTSHPGYGGALFNLASALFTRSKSAGGAQDLQEAVRLGTLAVDALSTLPITRLRSAGAVAGWAAETQPEAAADLLERAVRLLVDVSPHSLDRGDQEHALSQFNHFAADAAALALSVPDSPESALRALRLMEAGNGVLLGQELDVRDGLIALRNAYPTLAGRLEEVRRQLNTPDVSDQRTDRYHLAGELNELLSQIRAIDGFTEFATPPSTSLLQSQAGEGPIVTFVVSDYLCAALIIARSGVREVRLPHLTRSEAAKRASDFILAAMTANDRAVGTAGRVCASRQMGDVLRWLWNVAVEPVLEDLGYLRRPDDGELWPKVWWIGGHLLGHLPLHAAGHHDDLSADPARRTTLDRVVSAYTPTIRALHYSRLRRNEDSPVRTGLAIAMPSTPGLGASADLPHAREEVASLCRAVADTRLLVESGDIESRPTRRNVLAGVARADIVHFACHGHFDLRRPQESTLLLCDHLSDPLTVRDVAGARTGGGQLAYLAGCETASGMHRLPQETINFASAFQLAGFPHVVGALWAIDDSVAADVADVFYREMGVNGQLTPSLAAQALHTAVRAIREEWNAAPSLWAPFAYFGA